MCVFTNANIITGIFWKVSCIKALHEERAMMVCLCGISSFDLVRWRKAEKEERDADEILFFPEQQRRDGEAMDLDGWFTFVWVW